MTLSAVVTREGRIQNLEVLVAEQARALHVKPEVVLAHDRRRLARALRAGACPAALPVAVNVVWLVTTTTVKGRPDYDLYLVSPPRWPTPPCIGPARCRASAPRAARQSPAAGDDGLAA